MNDTEIVLIDLSSIAHPIWHMSAAEPDPNRASQLIVARVRALANGHRHVAICCDSGKSFRAEIAPSYKANRPESVAPLHHQITLAVEQLQADGFPVWAVRSFEADDLIAAATARALAVNLDVLIVSADKDLLQLVGPHVRAKSVRDGSIFDTEAVILKLGVPPTQVRDYLTLVGDASDNIKGATDIGPKKAAKILSKFGSLDAVYAALAASQAQSIGLPTAVEMSLREFQPRMATTRALVTLRTDIELPFEEIANDRVPKEVATFGMEEEEMDELPEPTAERAGQDAAPRVDAAQGEVTDLRGSADGTSVSGSASALNAQLTVREPEVLTPAPSEYERQLDPRSMKDAIVLAKNMYESRMFSAYGTPQAVLSTVMVGRELGLPAMASLRCINNIEGRHALAASLMVALVLKSGLAEYFEPISFTETEATFETKRKGARNPVKLTHTIEMAVQAGLVKDKSGWVKNPTDMLVARATARLARMVYPDLLAGLYTPEELAEIRESLAA